MIAAGWVDCAFIDIDAVVESHIGDVASFALANWRHEILRWSTVGVGDTCNATDIKWIGFGCADKSTDLIDAALSGSTWSDGTSALIDIDTFESL